MGVLRAHRASIFAYRVIQYSMIKYHYFLIDFCYYANVACFVQILALPGSPALFRSVFAYANGPITHGDPALAQLARVPLTR